MAALAAASGTARPFARCVGGSASSFRRPSISAQLGARPAPVMAAPAAAQRRGFVNAFVRRPQRPSVPSVNAEGVAIDRDKLIFEFDNFLDMLKSSTLIDTIHVMNDMPHFDSIKCGDLFTSHGNMILPMPRYGNEHKTSEINETLRYIRAAGQSADSLPALQEDDRLRAHAGDFVEIPNGMVIARSARTNAAAVEQMATAHAENEQQLAFHVYPVDLPDDAPPLGDLLGFGGINTLVVWDTPAGTHVAGECGLKVKNRLMDIVKVEPGCGFLTFSGGLPKYDVLVDEDFEDSIYAMSAAGLNPIPVGWSQFKLLGITMRQLTLVVRFARGHGGGGFHTHRAPSVSATRVFGGREANKKQGGVGAPFWSQLKNYELPEPVYQPPPRYVPPMHRKGHPVTPYQGDDQRPR